MYIDIYSFHQCFRLVNLKRILDRGPRALTHFHWSCRRYRVRRAEVTGSELQNVHTVNSCKPQTGTSDTSTV